jgi:hypothetical protein
MYLVQDSVYRGSTERAAYDTANALMETSGIPWNWEIINSTNRTVGLAKYDTNKGAPVKEWISSDKLAAVSNTDIQNLLGNDYGFYLDITSLDGSKSWGNRSTGGLGYNNTSPDVVKVEKIVLYSKLNAVSFIKGQIRGSGSPRDYSNPPDQFQTSYFYNQTYDYYIIVGNNSGYNAVNVTLNTNNTMVLNNLTQPNSQPYLINSIYLKMNQSNSIQLFNNTVQVRANSTPGSFMDLYIVQVKKEPIQMR